MGFSITTSNGVLAQDLPPITSNCSDMVYFQPVSSAPRLLSLLMCLTTFTWMPWNEKRRIKLFPKAEKVYKQCSPGICPCWSSSPMTLVSSLIGSFQNRYRELLRVSRQWRNLQALKRFGFGHGQSRDPGPGDLALFCPACPQPGINLPEGWEHDSNE